MNGRKQWFGSGYAGNNSQRLILCITQLFFSRIEIERMGVQECALWECEMRTADVAESLDVRKTHIGARDDALIHLTSILTEDHHPNQAYYRVINAHQLPHRGCISSKREFSQWDKQHLPRIPSCCHRHK